MAGESANATAQTERWISAGGIACCERDGRNWCGRLHADFREAALCLDAYHLSLGEGDDGWDRRWYLAGVQGYEGNAHLDVDEASHEFLARMNGDWLRSRDLYLDGDVAESMTDEASRAFDRAILSARRVDLQLCPAPVYVEAARVSPAVLASSSEATVSADIERVHASVPEKPASRDTENWEPGFFIDQNGPKSEWIHLVSVERGIACVTELGGWCGFTHPTPEEAILCCHEHSVRENRLDVSKFLAVVFAMDNFDAGWLEFEPHRDDEVRAAIRAVADKGVEQLRGEVGPAVVVRLAEAAERAAAKFPGAWASPGALDEARAAYAAAKKQLTPRTPEDGDVILPKRRTGKARKGTAAKAERRAA